MIGSRPEEIGTWDEEGEGEGVERGVRDDETKDDDIGDEGGEIEEEDDGIEEEDDGIVDWGVEGEEIGENNDLVGVVASHRDWFTTAVEAE